MSGALELGPWLANPLAHGALLAAALAVALWSYHRQRALGARRWALAALRGLAIVGIVVLLADPHGVRRTSEPARPVLEVLRDDEAADPALAALLERLAERFELHVSTEATLDEILRRRVDDATRGVLLAAPTLRTGDHDALALARRFGAAGVPIHALAPAAGGAELAIALVDAPEAVFLDDVLALRAHLRHTGPDPERASVALFRDGEPLQRRDVTLDAPLTEVLFEVDAPRPGMFTYELRAALVDGSSADSPAIGAKTVRVLDDPLRVLFVQDQPSWEWRFLREALLRDPQVGSGFHTHLATAAPQVASAANEYLRELPQSLEELSAYDVVVLGDVAVEALPARFQLALRELVAEHGGGLLFLAGRRHDPRAIHGTALEDLLPVRLDAADGGYVDALVHATPSARGAEHRALRLDPLPATSQRLWSELPALRSIYRASESRQLATVLLQDGANADRPLLVGRRFGAGQVAFAATDSTWRWRGLDGGAHFERYWGQLVRWLAIQRRSASAASGTLEAHAEEVALGGAVHLVASLPANDALADELDCLIRTGGDPPRPTTLRRRLGAAPVYEGRFTPARPGVYTSWLGDRERPTAWASFVVQPPSEATSADLARASGGRFVEPHELASFADALDADELERRTVTREELSLAWAGALLLALVALLTTEWIGRKRLGAK